MRSNLDPRHASAAPRIQAIQPLACRRRSHAVRLAASIAPPVSLFSFGANDTNACPTNTDPMAVADACEVAASAAGRPYGGTVELAFVPAGCVWLSAGGGFRYNTNASGAGHEAAQPVCAGAPSSESPRQQRSGPIYICVCVCVSACACVCVSVCVCIDRHMNRYRQIRIDMYIYIYIYIYIYMYTQGSHTRSGTRPHTGTHTCSGSMHSCVYKTYTRQAPREIRPRSALWEVSALWQRRVRSHGLITGWRSLLRRCRRRDSASCRLCSQPRGGPRCAAFDGKLSSKACPQGFAPVTTKAACQSLAAIGGKPYAGSVNLASFPPGCFWLTVGGGVYLNTHSDGNANPNAQPLCAGARRRAQPRITMREPSPRTHEPCDGACRRAVASALRIVVVTNPLLLFAVTNLPPCVRLQGRVRRRQGSALPAVWPGHLRRAACICATCHAAWLCPECLAAFQIGGTNTNSCPANYSRLETEAACKSLAAIAGATYERSDNYSYYPAGCFWHTVSRKLYWNTHGSGASSSFAQPLCAGAPATPPCTPRECVGAWLHVHASFGTRVYSVPRRYSRTQAVQEFSPLRRYSGTLCSGDARVLSAQALTHHSGGNRVLRWNSGTHHSGGTRVLSSLGKPAKNRP